MRPEVTRSRYIRYALMLHYYYSVTLGIISLRYDFGARRFRHAPLLRIYALLINALMICILPISVPASLRVLNFFGANRLMRLTHTFNMGVRCVVVSLTLITRWRRECRAKRIVAQLLDMEAEYFEAVVVPPCIQRRFTRLFCAKYFSVTFQTLSSLYTFVVISDAALTPGRLLLYFYILNVLNVLLGVMFHYFVALWHICKRFCILNAQLEAVFGKLKRHVRQKRCTATEQCLLAADVRTITCLHYRLTQFVQQLNDIYKYQVIGALLTQFINNIAIGYYSIAMGGGDRNIGHMHFSYLHMFLGFIMYWVTLLDLYLMDVIYDAIAVASRETGAVLRRFQEFDVLEPAVDRSCHLLSQHLMQQKLCVEICGMFVLNKQSVCLIIGATIKQIFILVQFELEKRFD